MTPTTAEQEVDAEGVAQGTEVGRDEDGPVIAPDALRVDSRDGVTALQRPAGCERSTFSRSEPAQVEDLGYAGPTPVRDLSAHDDQVEGPHDVVQQQTCVDGIGALGDHPARQDASGCDIKGSEDLDRHGPFVHGVPDQYVCPRGVDGDDLPGADGRKWVLPEVPRIALLRWERVVCPRSLNSQDTNSPAARADWG